MIFDMRTYEVQPGKALKFLAVHEENGLAIITKYARLIGWQKESGTLDSIVFIWAYEDFAHLTAQPRNGPPSLDQPFHEDGGQL